MDCSFVAGGVTRASLARTVVTTPFQAIEEADRCEHPVLPLMLIASGLLVIDAFKTELSAIQRILDSYVRSGRTAPVTIALNKVDTVAKKARLLETTSALKRFVSNAVSIDEVFYTCAISGDGCAELQVQRTAAARLSQQKHLLSVAMPRPWAFGRDEVLPSAALVLSAAVHEQHSRADTRRGSTRTAVPPSPQGGAILNQDCGRPSG